MSAAGLHGRSDPKALPEPRPAEPGGGERVVRPDQGRTGLGGTDAASETALNLADSVDGLTLDRDPMNRLDRSQVQRIKTAAERRSLDDRRATPNPMQLDFLATGPGDRPLRRPPSNWDPSAGVMSGTRPSERGGELGGPAVDDGLGPLPEPGDANPGTDRKRSARGVPDGALGRDVRLSARVALARPWVPRAGGGASAGPWPPQRHRGQLSGSGQRRSFTDSRQHCGRRCWQGAGWPGRGRQPGQWWRDGTRLALDARGERPGIAPRSERGPALDRILPRHREEGRVAGCFPGLGDCRGARRHGRAGADPEPRWHSFGSSRGASQWDPGVRSERHRGRAAGGALRAPAGGAGPGTPHVAHVLRRAEPGRGARRSGSWRPQAALKGQIAVDLPEAALHIPGPNRPK